MTDSTNVDTTHLNLLARLTLAVGSCGAAGDDGKTLISKIISDIGEQCFKQFYAELILVDQEKLGEEMFNIMSGAFNEYAAIKKGNE